MPAQAKLIGISVPSPVESGVPFIIQTVVENIRDYGTLYWKLDNTTTGQQIKLQTRVFDAGERYVFSTTTSITETSVFRIEVGHYLFGNYYEDESVTATSVCVSGGATLQEALTCAWANGWQDHGPMKTSFEIDEEVVGYSEVVASDMYGKVIKHEWWYKEEGQASPTKKWEYSWPPIDDHYTGMANWTHWEIGGAYGPGTGFIKVFCDGVHLGETNDYTIVAAGCSGYQDQTSCEAAGCYWWNNSCHNEPGVGAIGDILPSSEFYSGPFHPGSYVKIAMCDFGNIGDIKGNITCRLYEYPGQPNEQVLCEDVVLMYPGAYKRWHIRETIPNLPGQAWPLGIKVWGETESEPSW